MSAPLLHEWLAALARIEVAGIDARLSKGASTLIVGGRRVGDLLEYPVYHDAFNISFESAGIVLRIEGGGQLVDEYAMISLDEAVDELIRLRRPGSRAET